MSFFLHKTIFFVILVLVMFRGWCFPSFGFINRTTNNNTSGWGWRGACVTAVVTFMSFFLHKTIFFVILVLVMFRGWCFPSFGFINRTTNNNTSGWGWRGACVTAVVTFMFFFFHETLFLLLIIMKENVIAVPLIVEGWCFPSFCFTNGRTNAITRGWW